MPDQLDVLSIGGITFDAFSTPDLIPGGGRQATVVHKLPGGARVIDTLGRDDMDITWRGTFFSNDALNIALALDSLRIAGAVVPLLYAGQMRPVVISNFLWSIRRFPMWVEYVITCIVVQRAPSMTASDASGIDQSATNDASQANDVATGSQENGIWGPPPDTGIEGGTTGAPTTAPVQ